MVTCSLHAHCLGAEVNVWTARAGVVHSTFEHAVNLLIGGDLWTVLDATRCDYPFGIRLAPGDCLGAFGVRAGDPVHVRAGYVSIGRPIVDCRAACIWTPDSWEEPAAGIEVRLATLERIARRRAWPESISMASHVMRALGASDGDEALADAVGGTIGRGPGLTPAGDDVLAGIFAVLTSRATDAAGVEAASRLTRAVAPRLHSTSDISRHLLNQAARGLHGRALHDLGKALVEGAPDDVLAVASESVLGIGCTSGADACMGLVAACRQSFPRGRAVA